MTIEIINQYQAWIKNGIPCWYSVVIYNGIRNEIKLYQMTKPTESQLITIAEKTFLPPPSAEEVEAQTTQTLIGEVKSRPHLFLQLVTYIANFYRAEVGKAELTETQARNRLLA